MAENFKGVQIFKCTLNSCMQLCIVPFSCICIQIYIFFFLKNQLSLSAVSRPSWISIGILFFFLRNLKVSLAPSHVPTHLTVFFCKLQNYCYTAKRFLDHIYSDWLANTHKFWNNFQERLHSVSQHDFINKKKLCWFYAPRDVSVTIKVLLKIIFLWKLSSATYHQRTRQNASVC